MDNNLLSMQYALNTFQQASKIDEASLLSSKIKIFHRLDTNGQTALDGVTNDLITAYPNSNTYTVLQVSFGMPDPSSVYAVIIIRLN